MAKSVAMAPSWERASSRETVVIMPDSDTAPTDVELKRGVRVSVAFDGIVVAKPQDGALRVRVGNSSWYAVVPVHSATAENQRCYWMEDGNRCGLRIRHPGEHHV